MSFAVGIALALVVAAFAAVVGLDRDRAFYATVLIVVGSLYVLFAVMGGSVQAVMAEGAFMLAFAAIATVGFKSSPWIVAAGLAGHGAFDAVHGSIVTNAGVPAFWPAFCMAYDVTAGGVLAWLLWQRREPGKQAWLSRT